MALLFNIGLARAQAPNTLAGDGAILQISGDTPALPNSGYFVLLTDNSDNTYNLIGIYNHQNDSGTYTYSSATNAAQGTLVLNDETDGVVDQVGLTFNAALQGSFNLTSASNHLQTGNFTAASGTAPDSIAGKSFYCVISDGRSPFARSNTCILSIAASGNTYTITGSSGVFNSTGTYSYTVVNRSTAAIQVEDSNTGSSITYLSFSDSGSGIYAIAQTTNGPNPVGFQVGTFTSSDAVSAFFSDEVYLGGSWCYLAGSTNYGFGYYNNADYPFIYHLDLGWEYCFDAADTNHGAYFYDFTDSAFFYTEPALFPCIYDFNANAWLWYDPVDGMTNRYTSNPRWLFNFSTQQWTNSL